MQTTPEQRKGIAGTILVHLLLAVLMLYVLVLRTPLPLPGEEGVEIRMGNSDEGTFSEYIGQTATSAATSTPQSSAEEAIATQSDEETVAIEAPTKPQPQPNPNPQSTPETKPDPQPTADPRASYQGPNTTPSGGGTGTSGDYGRPDGNSATGGIDGNPGSGQGGGGGNGQGHNFFLKGRGNISLSKPSYNSEQAGCVVVEIFVDKNGNVTKARAGVTVLKKDDPNIDRDLKTTVTDLNLLKQAEQAALQSKFSKNDAAAEQQKGYIVYNFVKQGN